MDTLNLLATIVIITMVAAVLVVVYFRRPPPPVDPYEAFKRDLVNAGTDAASKTMIAGVKYLATQVKNKRVTFGPPSVYQILASDNPITEAMRVGAKRAMEASFEKEKELV